MRDVLRGIAIGIAILLVGGAIASRTGWIVTEVPRAASTAPWSIARATGFAAFAALALDVIAGLTLSTRVGGRRLARGALVELHGWLSPLAIALVLGHALVLLADGYIRFDALDVLVPFASPFRPVAVGLGVIAGYLALAVHASFALRRRIGTAWWRRLHYLSFVAFVAAAVHGVAAGTDRAQPWAIAIYSLPIAVVLGLLAIRIRRVVAQP